MERSRGAPERLSVRSPTGFAARQRYQRLIAVNKASVRVFYANGTELRVLFRLRMRVESVCAFFNLLYNEQNVEVRSKTKRK